MITVKNISKEFDGLSVIEDVSFDIHDNEIIVVLGPSGCGKSTLLNMLCGLESVTNGYINLESDNIAFVFQDNRLLPWETVYKNIELVKDDKHADEVSSLIDEVGLKGFEDYYPNQLSGGMQKRCSIARAFYYKSKLLLMDEPFSGLDYYLRNEMMKMLIHVWQKHKQSVLLVTHELDVALSIAHRIIILSDRPSKIIQEIQLDDKVGRNPNSDYLVHIKKEIISLVG